MKRMRILFWFLSGLLMLGAFNHKAIAPAYSFDDAWEETAPDGDLDDISTGDDQMRQDKRAIRERLAVDHNFVADEVTPDATIGYHQAIHLKDQAGTTPGNSTLYNDTDIVYWKNAAGTAKNIPTNGIALPSGAVFFMITGSCPTGSTDITATYSNKFVRINATGGSTGGADTHTQTYSTTSGAGTAHTHDRGGGGGASTQFGGGDSYIATESAHTHSVSGTTSAGDNVPAYVTCKMCSVN